MHHSLNEEILCRMRQSGALLSGHFKLSSGLHSAQYLQCALLLSCPRNAAFVGEHLAGMLKTLEPDCIVSPALGGMIVGHEVARALDIPFLFLERREGTMHLRRFPHPGCVRFILVEDVITTGKSTLETIQPMEVQGAQCVGVSCIADRTDGSHFLPKELISLVRLSFDTYNPADCPLCRSNEPLTQPGSRIV